MAKKVILTTAGEEIWNKIIIFLIVLGLIGVVLKPILIIALILAAIYLLFLNFKAFIISVIVGFIVFLIFGPSPSFWTGMIIYFLIHAARREG